MHEWFSVVLLGLIEGITEFLPVSSTGHLLIAERWLRHHQSDLFNTVVQCGAVLAVWAVFHERARTFLFQWRSPEVRDYLGKLVVAFGITGVLGLLMKKLGYRLPDDVGPVAWATLVGGLVVLAVEYWLRGRTLKPDITWTMAVVIGLAQVVAAVFPGTSRSGITILAGLALGANRTASAEFSFLLGIPTLLAAGLLQIVSAWRHSTGTEPLGPLVVASVVSAVVAFGVVKWFLKYVQNHSFVLFGWYRLALGILLLLWLS